MARKYGLNNEKLRMQNRGLVLKLIATGECNARIEVAKKMKLSKMAASNIIGEFIEAGIVAEKEAIRVAGKGRNPIHLCISENAPKLIGVYVGRNECVVVICTLQLKILMEKSFRINAENAGKLDILIYQAIDEILEKYKNETITGIGIGAIGPIDRIQGKILNPPNFYGLHDIAIVQGLKARYEVPVYLDSQYDCAALAEKYYGCAKGEKDFMFVGIGNGVGSGIVINDTLQRDSRGFTSELGHVSIDWNGRKCFCGARGCLETYVSSNVIEKECQELTGREKSYKEFCEIAKSGEDEGVNQKFEEMIAELGYGITNVVNLYNVKTIIMGHDGYWIPDIYMEKLEQQINENKLMGEYYHVSVKKSSYEDEAQIAGCAASVLKGIFDGEIEI